MLKRLIVSLAVGCMLYAISFVPVMAEEETCVTVSQYGGSSQIVCGAKHEPVETGLSDINPVVLAFSFFILSGLALKRVNDLKRMEVAL